MDKYVDELENRCGSSRRRDRGPPSVSIRKYVDSSRFRRLKEMKLKIKCETANIYSLVWNLNDQFYNVKLLINL